MSFYGFMVFISFSSGGHFVQLSRILAILEEVYPRIISENILKSDHWPMRTFIKTFFYF